MSKWTFALKDQGTSNQGWWLKISSIDELASYYERENPKKYGQVFEDYMQGKQTPMVDAVKRYSANHSYNILQGLKGFELTIAENQMRELHECGAIYINRVGGYHGAFKKDPEFPLWERDELIFPDNNYIPQAKLVSDAKRKSNQVVERQPLGWLSPMGKYYEAEWGDHEQTAREIIEELGIEFDDTKTTYRDKLSDLRWVLIHDPAQTDDYLVTNTKPLTSHQCEFLYNFFSDLGQPIRAESYLKEEFYGINEYDLERD